MKMNKLDLIDYLAVFKHKDKKYDLYNLNGLFINMYNDDKYYNEIIDGFFNKYINIYLNESKLKKSNDSTYLPFFKIINNALYIHIHTTTSFISEQCIGINIEKELNYTKKQFDIINLSFAKAYVYFL